jgi:predicted kinase
MSKKELIIAIGNIGTGKSLIARKYALKGYVVVNMDSIVTMLDGGEFGRYDSDKAVLYRTIEKAVLHELFETERPVFLDRTCVNTIAREKYIIMAKEYGYKVTALDFGPGDIATVQRRKEDNKGVSIETWDSVHQYFKTRYEPADLKEGFDDIIEAPKRFHFHAFDEFPSIGNQRPENIEMIKALYAELQNIIIIWTCRDNNLLLKMREYLISEEIPYDFINENPIFKTNSPKIFAHKYYDDRAFEIG